MGIREYDLVRTSDDVFISKVIADEDEGSRMCLVQHNPNLTETHLMALACDESVRVRHELAWRKSLPADVLEKLRSDEEEAVRVQALCNSQSEAKFFVEAVLRGKLSAATKKAFCSNVKAVSNFEAFKFLWESGKRSQALLVGALYDAVRLPDSPMTSKVLYDTASSPSPIDPKVFDVVHEVIRSGEASNDLKVTYAGASGVALPELLDVLMDDPYQPVIEGIARNTSAWVSTHEHLYANHKSKRVLFFLAGATMDCGLLNLIYRRTKSKEIRYVLENNPAFVLL